MANEELTKLRGGMLCYRYCLDDDQAQVCETHLLADIAPPYKRRFTEEIQNQDWIVEYGRKLPDSPFKADFVICTCDAAI